MELNPRNVEKIFKSCQFKKDETTTNAVMAEGITASFGFHPERLKENEIDISNLLKQLPGQFQEKVGGGWSFLNACNDKNDNLWTGMHSTMEQLMVLGVASKKAKYCLPKEYWESMPGGMPYFMVID